MEAKATWWKIIILCVVVFFISCVMPTADYEDQSIKADRVKNSTTCSLYCNK